MIRKHWNRKPARSPEGFETSKEFEIFPLFISIPYHDIFHSPGGFPAGLPKEGAENSSTWPESLLDISDIGEITTAPGPSAVLMAVSNNTFCRQPFRFRLILSGEVLSISLGSRSGQVRISFRCLFSHFLEGPFRLI